MADPFVSPLLLALATAYVAVWALNMVAAGAFSRLGHMIREAEGGEPEAAGEGGTPVTLVITHGGSGAELRRLLPAFLEQTYRNAELLLVSTQLLDREADLYLRLLTPVHPELHSRILPTHTQGVSAEALTLSLAMRTAEHPWVLVCRLQSRPAGSGWLGRMMAEIRPGTCFVAGVTLRRPQTFLGLWRLMMILPEACRRGLYTLPEDNLLVHVPTFLERGGMKRAAGLSRGILAEAVNRLSRPTNTRLCLLPEAFVWQPSPADAREAMAEELQRHHAELHFTRRAGHMTRQRAIVGAAWLHTLLLVAFALTASVGGHWWMAVPAIPMVAALFTRRTKQMAVTIAALGLPSRRLFPGWRLRGLAVARLRMLLAYDISDKNVYRKQTN